MGGRKGNQVIDFKREALKVLDLNAPQMSQVLRRGLLDSDRNMRSLTSHQWVNALMDL